MLRDYFSVSIMPFNQRLYPSSVSTLSGIFHRLLGSSDSCFFRKDREISRKLSYLYVSFFVYM